jgi:sirohydrochlorin ferrochelatase
MLEARIIAPRGSLYYAAEATPYDLAMIRQHLREWPRGRDGDVTLELTVDEPGRAIIAAWVGSLTDAGYQVRVRRQQHGASAA